MLAAVRDPLSITSGYSVPCTRNRASAVLARDLLEDADELLADRAPLPLGVGDPGQLREEPVLRLHVDERNAEVAAEGLLHLLGLPLPVQPVVDEDARELIADRAVDEERGDGGVDPSGERAQDLRVTDLLPDPGHRVLDDVHRGPVGQEPAAVVEEPLQHVLAPRCVRHLGVELDREQAALRILHRRDRDLVGARGHAEALGRPRDRVPVAHPDLLLAGEVGEEHAARLVHRQRGAAVLALTGGGDLPAERARHQLVPVADAEDRHAHVEQSGVDRGSAVLVDRRGSAREDQAGRPALRELGRRGVVRHDLRVDVRLPDAPRDQLCVLRPEVDDQDRPGGIVRRRPRRAPSAPSPPAERPDRSCPRS